jgi:hypothetical protein
MADVVVERARDAGADVADAVERVRRLTRVAGTDDTDPAAADD